MRPLANPFPVVDELAFQGSRKLIAFNNGRRLAKRHFECDTRALTSHRRGFGIPSEVIGWCFAAAVVECDEQYRFAVVGIGHFVGGDPRVRGRLTFRRVPKDVQILQIMVNRVDPYNRWRR